VITIASALMPNGCDVIASLPVERAAQPYPRQSLPRYSILNTPYSHCISSGQLSLWASGPLFQRILFPVHEETFRLEAERTAEGGDEGDITAGGGNATAPGRFFGAVMRRVPPFPAVGQGGDVCFGRGRGAGDGELLEASARTAMPAKRALPFLLQESAQAVDDDETVRGLDHPALGPETREAKVRCDESVGLPARRAGHPREPEEASDATHGVEASDGDEIMETRAGETIPAARGVVGIGPRVFGDPLAVPAQRDMQLVGMRRTRAECLRSAEESVPRG